jgi:hypothetical protein
MMADGIIVANINRDTQPLPISLTSPLKPQKRSKGFSNITLTVGSLFFITAYCTTTFMSPYTLLTKVSLSLILFPTIYLYNETIKRIHDRPSTPPVAIPVTRKSLNNTDDFNLRLGKNITSEIYSSILKLPMQSLLNRLIPDNIGLSHKGFAIFMLSNFYCKIFTIILDKGFERANRQDAGHVIDSDVEQDLKQIALSLVDEILLKGSVGFVFYYTNLMDYTRPEHLLAATCLIALSVMLSTYITYWLKGDIDFKAFINLSAAEKLKITGPDFLKHFLESTIFNAIKLPIDPVIAYTTSYISTECLRVAASNIVIKPLIIGTLNNICFDYGHITLNRLSSKLINMTMNVEKMLLNLHKPQTLTIY